MYVGKKKEKKKKKKNVNVGKQFSIHECGNVLSSRAKNKMILDKWEEKF